MRLTRNFKIPYRKDLIELFKASKELYNKALFVYKKNSKEKNYLNYYSLDKVMKTEYREVYKRLPAQVSQQLLRLLIQDIKSFWRKRKLDKKTGFPSFKRSEYFLLIFPNQSSKITEDRRLKLSRIKKPIRIPKRVYTRKFKKFQQVRLIPKMDYIKVEIIYKTEEENKELDYKSYASVDLGVNNIITLVSNGKFRPILVNGKPLKSYNLFHNQVKSNLQSIKDKMKLKSAKKLRRLELKRQQFFKDKFHKISKEVIRLLVKSKIGNLVIGYNKNWKQKSNLGKKNNQVFQQIPFYLLVNYLKYKGELVGIKITIVEESYTSKVDALALEKLPSAEARQKEFKGKRVKRGLFQSSTKVLINADVNGAINILRKIIGDGFITLSNKGFWCNPVKIREINSKLFTKEIVKELKCFT